MDTIVSQSTLFDFWREALPDAAGAKMSNEALRGITEETLLQSGVITGYDESAHAWAYDPSIVRARHFTTFVYGDETRKFGGTYRGTHPVMVGKMSYDDDPGPKSPESQILAAFEATLHDDPEDVLDGKKYNRSKIEKYRKITMDLIIRVDERSVWVGNPGLRGVIEKELIQLTDPPFQSNKARFHTQEKMLVEMSHRPIRIRYNDKKNNTGTDDELVQDGTISNPAEILLRAQLARRKVPLIEAMPSWAVPDDDKAVYMRHTESLEAAAKKAMSEITATEGPAGRSRVAQSTAMLWRQMRSATASFL